jgi:hypothetical protein
MEKLTMDQAIAKEAKRISKAFNFPEDEALRLLKRTAVYRSAVLGEQGKVLIGEIGKGLEKLIR